MIDLGLLIIQRVLLLAATLLSWSFIGNAAARDSEARIPTTVRRYSIIASGSRPECDPKDWKLLGSNDGGKTWATVDERKDEQFRWRMELRTFAVRNPGSFDTYRLQVTAVAD